MDYRGAMPVIAQVSICSLATETAMQQGFIIRAVWRLTLGPVFGFCRVDPAVYVPRSFVFCFAARGWWVLELDSMMVCAFDSRLDWVVKAVVTKWSIIVDGGTLDMHCL
jgi:hypothetical protein